MARAIGIDLGTTYSAVAVTDRLGAPVIVRNREGESITPSVVLFQGDVVIVGSQAKRSAATAPEHAVQFVKRKMGEPAPVYVAENGEEFRAEAVSALILKRLKEDAELALGEPVDSAVITVPAYFDDARRTATRDAGRLAGLEVLRILNEPTAAALAFGAAHYEDEPVGTVLVYDLGGGTFDVTVMSATEGDYRVIATDGDRNLGGFDWDNALMSHLNEKFVAAGGPDLTNDTLLAADLRDKAELAKRTLSTAPRAVVVLSAEGRHQQIEVTRETFDTLTAPLLDRTRILTEGVLEDARLTWADIDRVLLVGGSTRMPMVGEMMTRLSGKSPQLGVNQDEVVALGAALVALDEEVRGRQRPAKPTPSGDTQSGTPAAPPGAGLARLTAGRVKSIRDVTSQSLGIVVADEEDHSREYNMVIIPRNTPIPSRKTDAVRTLQDHQTRLRVRVTEGDDEELAYVREIGESTLKLPGYPKGAPIEVTYSYDLDGIVHVEVKDLTSGEWLGEFEVERPDNLDTDSARELTDRIGRTTAL